MSSRRFLIPVLLIFILAVGVFVATHDHQAAAPEQSNAVLEYREGGLLYTFHVPTGTEALFDLKNDPNCLDNILSRNLKRGAEARHRLEERLKVRSLDDFRDETNPVIQSLKGLGYI